MASRAGSARAGSARAGSARAGSARTWSAGVWFAGVWSAGAWSAHTGSAGVWFAGVWSCSECCARMEETCRVGMERRAEDLAGISGLHDTPPIHDNEAPADPRHHRYVVAYEQQRHRRLRHELVQQTEHPRLNRDVERCRRLIGQEQCRPAGYRHG